MPPRVLLVRTSALGDVVQALPVLTALRRHWPEARLGWVVEEALSPLLAGHPDLDEVIPARLRPWRYRPLASATRREIGAFLGALRRFRADVVLDLMGNHKAAVLARLSGARQRIGLARRFRREPSSALWINRPRNPRGTHAVDRALSLLDALGLPDKPADFGGEKLLREVPATVSGLLAEAKDPFVLLHPGAGWGNKVYPPTWWGAVSQHLSREAGLATWVATTSHEAALSEAVVAASGGAARTVPAPDLATLAVLIRGSRLVLGGDSGPIHLAHALGIPVLCVMGPTDPERHGPYRAAASTLAVRLPCSFCHKRFDETKACLLAIPPEMVGRRAQALLG